MSNACRHRRTKPVSATLLVPTCRRDTSAVEKLRAGSRRSPTRVAFSAALDLDCPYNIPMPIPRELEGQNYISLVTFRKSGAAVPTPIWFGEDDDKIYVMTRSDSGKYKRIRNNPEVRVAPCSIRGKITGPEFEARARILPPKTGPALARRSKRSTGWREFPSSGARRTFTSRSMASRHYS